MTVADLEQMWGDPLGDLVDLHCLCCKTALGDHSMTEAMRCARALAPPKRRGSPPNPEGCQSRLYGRWGVHAKCWLEHDDVDSGGEPDLHSNGYRKWTSAESAASFARWRAGRKEVRS